MKKCEHCAHPFPEPGRRVLSRTVNLDPVHEIAQVIEWEHDSEEPTLHKCPSCGQWTIIEEAQAEGAGGEGNAS